MPSHQFDQFVKKTSRFYLHAAHTRTLEPITGTGPLLAALEKEYAPLRSDFAETPLASYLSPDAATLYRQWTADNADLTTLSTRASETDLNLLLDEAAWINDLVGDSVIFLQDLQRETDPDDAGLILVGLNIEILRQRWDHLNDAFIINVAHDLRSSYELFVEQICARRGKDFSPIDLSWELLYQINAAIFLAEAFYRAFLAALNELALFHIPDLVLRPRPKFEDPETGRLAAPFRTPEFLDFQIEQLDRIEALMKSLFPRLAERFTPDLWQETGELHPLPLLLAQLWDDRGLLSRLPSADLYQMVHREGFLAGRLKNLLVQIRKWTEGLIKVQKLTEISKVAEHIEADCLALRFDSVPLHREGTPARIDEYEHLILEKKEAIGAHLLALHEQVGQLGVDYSNILDPTIEELIACQPEESVLSIHSARNLVHLAHKSGAYYESIQHHFLKMEREARYLRKLFPFHQEALEMCRALIGKKDYKNLIELDEELQRKFPDLDYTPVETAIAEWRALLASHRKHLESFAAFESETRQTPLRLEQIAALRHRLTEWEGVLAAGRASVDGQPENDWRREIEAFLAELEPRVAEARQRLA